MRRLHSAARTETTSHHRLPRLAATTPDAIADSRRRNPATSVAGVFTLANTATAPAAGIARISDAIDAKPNCSPGSALLSCAGILTEAASRRRLYIDVRSSF